MADVRALAVWMNGERVGHWHVGRAGAHRFVYAADWTASSRARPLSLSLPFTRDRSVSGAVVANYFDNLLPDDDRIRRRIASRFGTASSGAFDLLQAIGRDCVGAVQLLPVGVEPDGIDRIDAEPMTEAAIARHLRGVVAGPMPGESADADDFRFSIAGAQEKTALLRVDGQWCRPLGATPTTHIAKLPMGVVGGRRLDLTHSVHNEWLCGQWLEAVGLPVARTEMARFEDQQVLVVERFDRQRSTSPQGLPWIIRLPQEDLCQALGLPPDAKYEASGGPSLQRCVEIMRGGEAPSADVSTFLCAQLAFWLLAATDGHAKNFSLFLLPSGERAPRYRMTPLYDVLSVWPVTGNGANQLPWRAAKLAFALRTRNAHYALDGIQPRHWAAVAARSGVTRTWTDMLALVDRVEPAIETVQAKLPADFPPRIADAIFTGLRAQVRRWRAGQEGLPPPVHGGDA